MKKEIKTTNRIDAPIDQVWEHLRTGENVNSWLPIITSCRLEGNNRICSTENGELEETILKSDDDTKTFQYSIEKQNMFPIENILGTMKLNEVGQDQTDLHWDISFSLEDESLFTAIKEGIEGVYQMGAAGLEQLSKTTV